MPESGAATKSTSPGARGAKAKRRPRGSLDVEEIVTGAFELAEEVSIAEWMDALYDVQDGLLKSLQGLTSVRAGSGWRPAASLTLLPRRPWRPIGAVTTKLDGRGPGSTNSRIFADGNSPRTSAR